MPYTEEMIRSLTKQRTIFMWINIVAGLSMFILFYFSVHQQHQITHQTAVIQQERYNAVFRSCSEQNERHQSAVEALDLLLKNTGVNVKRREQSRSNTLLLINALAPVRDCKRLAERTVPTN